MKTWRILIINPGSTSTKLSLFENEVCLFTEDTFHDSSLLLTFPTINDQLPYRMQVVREFLARVGVDLRSVDAIVGRGGGCCAIPGGVYAIDERLVRDTREARGGLYHASMLGVQMAAELGRETGALELMDEEYKNSYVMNPSEEVLARCEYFNDLEPAWLNVYVTLWNEVTNAKAQ